MTFKTEDALAMWPEIQALDDGEPMPIKPTQADYELAKEIAGVPEVPVGCNLMLDVEGVAHIITRNRAKEQEFLKAAIAEVWSRKAGYLQADLDNVKHANQGLLAEAQMYREISAAWEAAGAQRLLVDLPKAIGKTVREVFELREVMELAVEIMECGGLTTTAKQNRFSELCTAYKGQG